jgi:hypothetical protein
MTTIMQVNNVKFQVLGSGANVHSGYSFFQIDLLILGKSTSFLNVTPQRYLILRPVVMNFAPYRVVKKKTAEYKILYFRFFK